MNFIDLQAQYRALKAEIDQGIQKVLDHGQFILGPEVGELEKRLAGFTGRAHCVACANGTDALQLAFMALGIGRGDAVFCPDVTFISTVEPAVMLGATAVFGDISLKDYNLDPQNPEEQIRAVKKEGRLRPAAVVAVDFLGNPADYESLTAVCKKYEVPLIEDAAQSFGAELNGRKCGFFGYLATTSFFPAKPLGCYGDGGAVFTDDPGLAEVLKSLRVHGKGPGGKYDNIRIGLNSRLDTIQAAILLPKLKVLEEYEMAARQKVAGRYNEAFKGKFVTPEIRPGAVSAYAQYALLAADGRERQEMIDRLNQAGVPNMIYYPTPQHLLPVFRDAPLYGQGFANALDYCARTFSLPMHPYLTEAEQDKVIGALR